MLFSTATPNFCGCGFFSAARTPRLIALTVLIELMGTVATNARTQGRGVKGVRLRAPWQGETLLTLQPNPNRLEDVMKVKGL
jgi:hypothetical protein